MNKSEILADRLEEVIYDSPWYGQNINDILSKINATQALIRINNQHSIAEILQHMTCLLYTSPSPRDRTRSRMPSSA